MDMAKIDDWLSTIISDQTRKSYKSGIRRFEEFYKKPIETLIGSENAGRVIEKFFVWLKNKGRSQNTCRTTVNAPIQFLKYFNTPVRYRRSLGIYKTTLTIRDHMLNVDEVREMYEVGSLEEKVMVKTWLLGLRIGDACRIKWKQFNFTPTVEPQKILIHTRKEGIVAHVFVDSEFQELLAKHIPNLDQKNKFLFQSEKGDNLKEKQLRRKLQNLQKKAHVEAKGVFGWHIGRKLFLRTCAELGVSAWNAKLMCGKAVEKSIATYINGVQLVNDAKKVHKVLAMQVSKEESSKISNLERTILSLERENLTFKTRIDLLQKGYHEIKDSIDNLYLINKQYPLTVERNLINKKTKKMEVWTETINTPKEMEIANKEFQKKLKKLSKK
jgi:integrase